MANTGCVLITIPHLDHMIWCMILDPQSNQHHNRCCFCASLMQFLGSLKPFELREVYTQVQKLKHSDSHRVTDTRKVGETARRDRTQVRGHFRVHVINWQTGKHVACTPLTSLQSYALPTSYDCMQTHTEVQDYTQTLTVEIYFLFMALKKCVHPCRFKALALFISLMMIN